jgi:hypothetical protein
MLALLRSSDLCDSPIINCGSFDMGVNTDNADENNLKAVYAAMEHPRQAFAT